MVRACGTGHRSADAATREVLHDVGRLVAGHRPSAAPPLINAPWSSADLKDASHGDGRRSPSYS
eukprot:4083168-Prymnesium_polylepis.2